jgi:hypothetical protein
MNSDTVLSLKPSEGYLLADLKVRRCDGDAIDLDMDHQLCPNSGVHFIPEMWHANLNSDNCN